MASTPSTRNRRRTCWWEPTYDPALVGTLVAGSWDFSHARGPTKCHFDGQDFEAAAKSQRHKFASVTFTDCDFQGFFNSAVQIAFNDCVFTNCDFGLTTWTNIKFSRCKFSKCSFGMTNFNNCEFRACEWSQIGLSPNMLQLNSTYIANPGQFIAAAYTNTDSAVLSSKKADLLDQVTRLEHTKATIARRIFRNLQEEGDEKAFYDAIKTFQLQQSRARQHQARFDMLNLSSPIDRGVADVRFIGWYIESLLLRLIGEINDWGASIVKPILLNIISVIFFAVMYHWLCKPTFAADAWMQRSFDITILAGYGDYDSEKDLRTVIVQNVHLIWATLLYAVTFTTIVARLSRVR
jgi:hypothetical protein